METSGAVENSATELLPADNLRYERVELTKIPAESVAQDLVAPKTNRKSWRKWAYAILASYIVLQIYYVREMLAALLIFTIFFAFFALVGTIIYILGRAGQAGIQLAEPAAKRGIGIAEEISKKTFHRPRSVPAP